MDWPVEVLFAAIVLEVPVMTVVPGATVLVEVGATSVVVVVGTIVLLVLVVAARVVVVVGAHVPGPAAVVVASPSLPSPECDCTWISPPGEKGWSNTTVNMPLGALVRNLTPGPNPGWRWPGSRMST